MTADEKALSCMQVADINEAKQHYVRDLGCILRREHGTCATFDCQDNAYYICETPKDETLSKAPHDELDEIADAFWCEEPGYC